MFRPDGINFIVISQPAMNNTSEYPLHFTKAITINAPVQVVWTALTMPGKMKQWRSPDNPVGIITDWATGSPFTIRGRHYKIPFENNGTVL